MPKDFPDMEAFIAAARDNDSVLDILAQTFADSVVETITVFTIPTKIFPPCADTDRLPNKHCSFATTIDLHVLHDERNVTTPGVVLLEELHNQAVTDILPKLEDYVWEWLRDLGYVHTNPLTPVSKELRAERAALWVEASCLENLCQWPEYTSVVSTAAPGGFVGRVHINGGEYVVLADVVRYDTMRTNLLRGEWAYIGEDGSPNLTVLPAIKVDKGKVTISFTADLYLTQ